MKKLICSLFIIFISGLSVMANPDKIVKKAIQKSDISETALISVAIKEIESNKTVVNYNSKVPMSVASVQKIVTTIPAYSKLGKDYDFKTQIFKDKNKNMYIKLGADPYLTSRDLKYLIKEVKEEKLNGIYVDDYITDRFEWGEGWQWDNTLNTYMPKFGAYNIDSNLISIVVRPTSMNSPADIFTIVFYPINFQNETRTGTTTDLKFVSRDYMQPDFIEVSGTVSEKVEKLIPINDLRKYFILRVKDSLRSNKISYYGKYDRRKVSGNLTLVAESKHNIEKVLYDIMQKSNNVMSETLFKVAGGGEEEKAIQMFKDYYTEQGIDINGIKIVDASGVSKNNLLNADFITSVLLNNYSKPESIKKYMAVPGVGTLQYRMFYLKDKLIAKTGTLQNVSAIAGYLTAESGKVYAFCIIINDAKSTSSERKAFEEYVIRTAYEAL